ncbi:MAG: lipopolysaccharide biosynthesis protein [Candidatus Latescibacterota bacterium]|nr:MAG: lipopolysaccharide biosynthesis protein [Candidatus Latescibacterota bacterium]
MTRSHEDNTPKREAQSGDVLGDEVLSGLIGRLGSDTLRYIPAIIVPAVVSILYISIFTRIFAPGPYGEYALVYVIVAILTSAISGWLQQSVLRYLPRYRQQGQAGEFLAKFGSILWAVAALILIAGLLLTPLIRPLAGGYARYYAAAVVWVMAGVIFFVQNHAFRANLQSATFSRYQVLYSVGRLVFALLFVYLVSRDVIGMIVGAVVAYLVLLVPMMLELGVFREMRLSGFSIDFKLLKNFARYGFPLVGFVLGVKVLDLSDRFIIELFRDSEEVGIYAANSNVVTMGLLFVATPLLSAALPLIVSTWEQGHQAQIQSVISNFSRYYLLAAIPVMGFTIVYCREIATVLLGSEFREGYRIMPLVLVGSLLWNFGMYGHKGIKLLEKTRVMLVLVLTCCVVNIVLNVIVVPTYGYFGAAVTTMVSHSIYPVMVYFVTKRYLRWMIPWRSALNIGIAGLLASAGWWGVQWYLTGKLHVVLILAIGLVAGMTVYAGVLFLIGELRDYEKRLITFRRSV